jgi:hypothetical protein
MEMSYFVNQGDAIAGFSSRTTSHDQVDVTVSNGLTLFYCRLLRLWKLVFTSTPLRALNIQNLNDGVEICRCRQLVLLIRSCNADRD